jgi:excisionase family DNA binding protein
METTEVLYSATSGAVLPPTEIEPPVSLEPLLNIKQTAKILGIREKTLRDWVWRKKIPHTKPGGDNVKFEPEAIRRFIARSRIPAKQRVM